MLKSVAGAITNIRAHRNAAAAALDSAKRLAVSGPIRFVPALCAVSIHHLLLGLTEIGDLRDDKGSMKALAVCAPFAFQSSERSLMDELEKSRNLFYTAGSRGETNEHAGEILERCRVLYDMMMSRAVLSI